MRKTIFALVLALLCMLTAVPALAAANLTLGGVDILSNPSGNIGGGTYAYDAATKTLTLTNVYLERSGRILEEYGSDDSLDTIVLEGENIIEAADSYAILVSGDITFTGEGRLDATAFANTIQVGRGDLIIDGAEVAVENSFEYSTAIVMMSEDGFDFDAGNKKMEIRNGGSLSVTSNGANTVINCGSEGGISVTGGSELTIVSQNPENSWLYKGPLTVNDTSRVAIQSYYGGLPEQTMETAEAAILTAKDLNRNYGLSFNKGSEPYTFTVYQIALEDGRNQLNIIGEEESSSEGGSTSGGSMPGGSSEGTATRAPMPETGDESHPILWAAMLLTAVVWFATRKRANA